MFIFIILSTIALISIIISICSVSQSSSVANESNFNYDINNENDDFDCYRNNFIIEYNEIVYEDNVSIIDNKCRVYYKDFNSCNSSTMNVSDENGNVYTVFNHQNQDSKCWYDEDYDSGYGYNFSDEYDSYNSSSYYEDNNCSNDYYGSCSYDGWLSSESDEDNGWF